MINPPLHAGNDPRKICSTDMTPASHGGELPGCRLHDFHVIYFLYMQVTYLVHARPSIPMKRKPMEGSIPIWDLSYNPLSPVGSKLSRAGYVYGKFKPISSLFRLGSSLSPSPRRKRKEKFISSNPPHDDISRVLFSRLRRQAICRVCLFPLQLT